MRLNINEMARRLELPVTTVERWIRQGRIPMQKSGYDCIFEAAVLEKWARKHHFSFTASAEALLEDKTGQAPAADFGSLSSAMKRGRVVYHIKGDSVTDLLCAVVDQLPDLSASQKAELLEKLLERERLTSTGIGKGIAIPHPRSPMPDLVSQPTVITCFLEHAVDFSAIDDQPVRVLFLLLSPNVKNHLHLLSRLSFCVRDDAFVSYLNTVPDIDSFFNKIDECEKKLDKAERSQG